MTENHYDIVILGSGIVGSALALTLSRTGCRTLVVEKSRHPRFAIGESNVPTSALWMRRLARRYDVPELAEVGHYLGLKKYGLVGYPKRCFWFGYHRDGAPLRGGEQLVFDALRPPVGPDVHMYRAEVDAFLVSRFPAYGVDYLDHSELAGFRREADTNLVRLKTPRGAREVRCRFVVDASGPSSYFANAFGLRETPPRLQTNTRTIFGHFRNVRSLDETLPGYPHPFRNPRDGGTVHHCFSGGWIWVIPFDNGLSSVGLTLDNERFPLDKNVSAEEELRAVIARYPSVQSHLGGMEPVRLVVRTGRLQYSAGSIAGDGFLLTPHAAAFVDPLFSGGMLLSMAFIGRLVPLLERALNDGDFSRERFLPLQEAFFLETEMLDQLAGGTLASFRDFEILREYWRAFIHASAVQYFTSAGLSDEAIVDRPVVYGADFADWRRQVAAMHGIVMDVNSPAADVAARLKNVMDGVPDPFRRERYEAAPGEPVYMDTRIDRPHVARWLWWLFGQPELWPHLNLRRQLPFLLDVLGMGPGQVKLAARYWTSRLTGSDFHRWVDAFQQSGGQSPAEAAAENVRVLQSATAIEDTQAKDGDERQDAETAGVTKDSFQGPGRDEPQTADAGRTE